LLVPDGHTQVPVVSQTPPVGEVQVVPLGAIPVGLQTVAPDTQAVRPVRQTADGVQAVGVMLSTMPSQLSSMPLQISAVPQGTQVPAEQRPAPAGVQRMLDPEETDPAVLYETWSKLPEVPCWMPIVALSPEAREP
jgi:hypothetical protein